MTYPRKLLLDDEEVLFDAHPHWVRLTRPLSIGVIALGACIAIFVVWRSAPSWVGIALGVVALVTVVSVASRIIAWRATNFVVTSMRVIARSGVLRRIGKEIPLGRVQDVSYRQRLSERVVGAGTLVIESAGTHGAEMFGDVRRPQMLQTLINHAQASSTQVVRNADGDQERSSVSEQLEHLGELHRRGLLTDQEFNEKRTQLVRHL